MREQRNRVKEQYYCNFGINPAHRTTLDEGGFHVVGEDADGEVRVFSLPTHPFFVATLFVPQLTSTAQHPHPLIVAFLKTAMVRVRVNCATTCRQSCSRWPSPA